MEKSIKKIYLAGPMRGYPQYNFPAFEEARTRLRGLGFDVWCPAENDVTKDNFNPVTDQAYTMAHYMERDLPAVCQADAVAVLPGWEKSEGATLEVHVGRKVGKAIISAVDLQPVSANPSEVRVTDPKTGGQKGQKLARFDLIPMECLWELACVYGQGAKKYDDDNWRKGYSWRLSLGGMFRHAVLWMLGLSRDEDTSCHHLAQVAWHAFTLMWFELHEKGTDDRALAPKKIAAIIQHYERETKA